MSASAHSYQAPDYNAAATGHTATGHSNGPVTIGDLGRHEVIHLACSCGARRKEKVTYLVEARLHYIRLDQMADIMVCGTLNCDGRMDVVRTGLA